jgi:hypothetical protein
VAFYGNFTASFFSGNPLFLSREVCKNHETADLWKSTAEPAGSVREAWAEGCDRAAGIVDGSEVREWKCGRRVAIKL